MNILIDWDSTLNQFEVALSQSINEKFGTTYTKDDHTHWDWLRVGMPRVQVDYLWKELFRDREWNLKIPPAPGARMATNRLLDAGHQVHVVSSRFKYMRPWITEWLFRHGFNADTIRAETEVHKDDYARRHGIDLWMEDAPHNARALSRIVPGYLIDRPWNQEFQRIPGYHEVRRTASVFTAVENMMGGPERHAKYPERLHRQRTLGGLSGSDMEKRG